MPATNTIITFELVSIATPNVAMSFKPGFRGFSKVSGYAEIWDETDTKKLEQSGWRTGTNESAYSTDTLIGNWNEQRFDVTYISKRRSLPSQVGRYTMYDRAIHHSFE